jgi:hypothetical protein
MKNYQAILTVIVSYLIAYLVMTGIAQQYVYFAGELNEIAVTILALTMGTMSLFAIDYKKILKALI